MIARLPDAAFVLAVVSFWTDPIERSFDLFRSAYRIGVDNGSLETPAYSACSLLTLRLSQADSLPDIEAESQAFLHLTAPGKVAYSGDIIRFGRQFIRRLRGHTRGLGTFDDGEFDERSFEAGLGPERNSTMMAWYWITKQRAAFLAGDVRGALQAGDSARPLLFSTAALTPYRDFVLYRGLTLAAALGDASATEPAGSASAAWQDEVAEHLRTLARWAATNPRTFRHAHALLAAEAARVEGNLQEALRRFDEAIQAAEAASYTLELGLAWELAARCLGLAPKGPQSALYLLEARAAYVRCGAEGKVRALEPERAARAPIAAGKAIYVAPSTELDVLSVVKASQAISGELTVERVVRRLMEVVLAEGGAERGLLLLVRDDALTIAAEAVAAGGGVEVKTGDTAPVSGGHVLPLALSQYVFRTALGVVLDDVGKDPRFAADPYVVEQKPRAVLCTPIRRQGQVIGLVYLENRAVAGTFTRKRLDLLELLASQAAISLENAALLEHEREAVRVREDFLSVASHELNTPLASLTLTVQTLLHPGAGLTSPAPSAAQPALTLIERQARRLRRLVGQLLDVTRMQHEAPTLTLEEVDLASLVSEVVEHFQSQLTKAGCTVSLALERPLLVRGDRGRLEQVVLNLLTNAAKFGAGAPIEISATARAAMVELSVSDHGIGVDPARQSRVFDRFERAVSASHYGGLGLGLYICRELVAAHGGTIRLASQPGEGARFTVELPRSGPVSPAGVPPG